ncbi:MAG TPA: chemotaxis protein CheD [Bryobacteraceae bacterium]|nr:chemotaxis protein CheD [Bryobacteraceae bacterium]
MAAPVVVGIGDAAVSADPDSELVTYALGSCVAVVAWDPRARAGGLVHYMLPLSVLDARRAESRPFMYCDTGLPLLLERLYGLGAKKERLVLRAAGGAQVLDENGIFNIGRKNEQILRQILAGFRLHLDEENFGGAVSRSVGLEVATGRFWLREYPVTMTQRTADTGSAVGREQ